MTMMTFIISWCGGSLAPLYSRLTYPPHQTLNFFGISATTVCSTNL